MGHVMLFIMTAQFGLLQYSWVKNVFYDAAWLEKFIGKSLAFNEVHKIRDLSYNTNRARRCNFGMNSLHRHCVQFTDERLPSQGTASIGNDCLILMNILSYKLNYLVLAAVRAELKLLLFNSVSGFLFNFLCLLLFTVAFSVLWNLYYFSSC